MPSKPRARAAPHDRKLVSVTWPLALAMSLMLVLSLASISVLSSVRAYVNGESLWSKAERQAIADLRRFSQTGEERDWQSFQAQLAVPLGDRTARLQMLLPDPDSSVAERGLLAGHNNAADIQGMIRIFRLFHTSSLMAEAVRIWTDGDALILQLGQTGERLHAQLRGGPPEPRRVAELLADAEAIHLKVAPLEDGFSAALGEASRRLSRLLWLFLSVCSALLVAGASAVSRANVKRAARLASELRASEQRVYLEQERAHVTLGSIADAVVSADQQRQVTYMNAAAERLTGWGAAEAQGRALTEVVSIVGEADARSVTTQLERVFAGESLSGPASGMAVRRRDGAQIAIHERAAPLRGHDGESLGIVLVLRDVTQERAFAARLEYQAKHDSLTGLTNRVEFEAQLALAIDAERRNQRPHALLYLDLDQFKIINDTCGHAAGDELIRQVAWLIRSRMRAGDVLARLGGDEFGALLPDTSANGACALAEDIRQQIADLRFRWLDKLFVVNASMGVVGLGETLPSVGETLAAADQACYLAKDNGRNRVQLYRPDDQQVLSRAGEMRWVERLNTALEQGSFVFLAQEIRPVSAEAHAGHVQRRFELLLRMVGLEGELIAPMAFIPAAERYGLMPTLDRWVIAQACRELAQLRARGLELPTCMINLSGTSVSDPSLADYIGDCLRANGIAPRHLGIELTETAAIGNLGSATQLMSRLQRLGCPIALDDFGSGMSSFSYLKSLPIDFLKIDGAFVRDITTDKIDLAVVQAIHHVGSLMGIKTVAECVEDAAALSALARIGVDFAQGYHIQRPQPLAQIELGGLAAPTPIGMARIRAR